MTACPSRPAELKAAIEPFEKIRRAVGDKMEIMVEFHCLWNLPMAKKLARWLEPYSPTWYEDPIRMNSPQALAELARSTDVWICASETLGSRFPYKDMLDRDAMGVVMADLCWTGGLTEGRKIAAMADTYHRPFAPHDCVGPVGFIAGIHASFSQPNTLIQESVRAFYTGWYKELVTVMPVIEDGFVLPMEGPGWAPSCCRRCSSAPTSPCAGRRPAHDAVRPDRAHRAGHRLLPRAGPGDGGGPGAGRRRRGAERLRCGAAGEAAAALRAAGHTVHEAGST